MRRRPLFLMLAGLACLAALGLTFIRLLPAPPGITKANYDRIEIGMTEQEVVGVFSKPPTLIYNSAAVSLPDDPGLLLNRDPWSYRYFIWVTDHESAAIAVDKQTKTVLHKRWRAESSFDKVRRWLHLD